MVEAKIPNSHKDQGNDFYKAEQWLKAAACYTKGIKEEPENTVLYRYRLDCHTAKESHGTDQNKDRFVAAIGVRPF